MSSFEKCTMLTQSAASLLKIARMKYGRYSSISKAPLRPSARQRPPLVLHPSLLLLVSMIPYLCHTRQQMYIREKKKPKPKGSGLVTEDDAVFQIDGNLGFLAGVNEMLLQSRYLYPRK